MTSRKAATRPGTRRFRFFGETIAELKKVVWLTRREAAYLTMLVLVVSISVGIFLGVIDYVFNKLVNNIFLGG